MYLFFLIFFSAIPSPKRRRSVVCKIAQAYTVAFTGCRNSSAGQPLTPRRHRATAVPLVPAVPGRCSWVPGAGSRSPSYRNIIQSSRFRKKHFSPEGGHHHHTTAAFRQPHNNGLVGQQQLQWRWLLWTGRNSRGSFTEEEWGLGGSRDGHATRWEGGIWSSCMMVVRSGGRETEQSEPATQERRVCNRRGVWRARRQQRGEHGIAWCCCCCCASLSRPERTSVWCTQCTQQFRRRSC